MALGRKTWRLRRSRGDDVEVTLWEDVESHPTDDQNDRFSITVSEVEWTGLTPRGALKVARALRRMAALAAKLSERGQLMWMWLRPTTPKSEVDHVFPRDETQEQVAPCGASFSAAMSCGYPIKEKCCPICYEAWEKDIDKGSVGRKSTKLAEQGGG